MEPWGGEDHRPQPSGLGLEGAGLDGAALDQPNPRAGARSVTRAFQERGPRSRRRTGGSGPAPPRGPRPRRLPAGGAVGRARRRRRWWTPLRPSTGRRPARGRLRHPARRARGRRWWGSAARSGWPRARRCLRRRPRAAARARGCAGTRTATVSWPPVTASEASALRAQHQREGARPEGPRQGLGGLAGAPRTQRRAASRLATCTMRGWVDGPTLHREDAPHRQLVRGVGAEAVDGLGGEGDQAAAAERGDGPGEFRVRQGSSVCPKRAAFARHAEPQHDGTEVPPPRPGGHVPVPLDTHRLQHATPAQPPRRAEAASAGEICTRIDSGRTSRPLDATGPSRRPRERWRPNDPRTPPPQPTRRERLPPPLEPLHQRERHPQRPEQHRPPVDEHRCRENPGAGVTGLGSILKPPQQRRTRAIASHLHLELTQQPLVHAHPENPQGDDRASHHRQLPQVEPARG